MLVPAFIFIIGMLRYRGEYFTRKMYDSINSGNSNAVIKNGTDAGSFAYSLDPTSVSFTWYTGNAMTMNNNMGGARFQRF